MGIGGLYSGSHLYHSNLYNSYPPRDIPQVEAKEITSQNDQNRKGSRPEEKAVIPEGSYQPSAEDRRSRSADLENISLTFNANEEGGTIGRDSNILNLDMQKAISDMKKDRILEDYQYFVGSVRESKAEAAGINGNSQQEETDGIVIPKF